MVDEEGDSSAPVVSPELQQVLDQLIADAHRRACDLVADAAQQRAGARADVEGAEPGAAPARARPSEEDLDASLARLSEEFDRRMDELETRAQNHHRAIRSIGLGADSRSFETPAMPGRVARQPVVAAVPFRSDPATAPLDALSAPTTPTNGHVQSPAPAGRTNYLKARPAWVANLLTAVLAAAALLIVLAFIGAL